MKQKLLNMKKNYTVMKKRYVVLLFAFLALAIGSNYRFMERGHMLYPAARSKDLP